MPSQSTRFSKGIVYGVTVVPLLVTLGFYFLERVPDREEYFLNLRFRTLAVIGKQIETKVEAISSGLTYGKFNGELESGPTCFEDYVGMVFPALQLVEESPAARPTGAAANPCPTGHDKGGVDPDIEFVEGKDRVQFAIDRQEKQRWEGSLATLIRPFTEDPDFDDVMLADEKGIVLFQRSNSTPKMRDVSAFLKKQEGKEGESLALFHGLRSEGHGDDSDLLKRVDLDGSEYQLFAQPLTIQIPRSAKGKVDLLLCGLIRSQRLRREAMDVPPRYLLWIVVPLLAGLLSGPFLKLVLVRRTGRLETRDLPLLTLFSCLVMAMLMVVLLAYHREVHDSARREQELKGVADRLNQQLRTRFQAARQLLRQIDAYGAALDSQSATLKAQNRERIWSWGGLVGEVPGVKMKDLNFVFWADAAGNQIEKWTPHKTNTPFYRQEAEEHYRLAVAEQYWRDRDDLETPFTGEVVVSPTTSIPIAVTTIRSLRNQELTLGPARKAADPGAPAKATAAFISLVTTPRSFLSPVVPSEIGFVFVRNDGSVLYDSNPGRTMKENLFMESEDSANLRYAVTTHTPMVLAGSYRGSDVTYYVRPVYEIAGIPWTIVVFRELKPAQEFLRRVCLNVLLLYMLFWTGPGLLLLATLLCIKSRRKCSWSGCRIRAMRYFWPHGGVGRRYRALARIEVGMIVGFLALLAWFSRRPDGVAGTLLLVAAMALPLGAMVAWVWQLRRRPPAGTNDHWQQEYVVALCLGLMIASVLPVTAFFQLSEHLESEIQMRYRQRELAAKVLKHRSEAVAVLLTSENMDPEARETARGLILPSPETRLCDHERLYEAFNTRIWCKEIALPEVEEAAWKQAMSLLRAQPLADPDPGSGALADFRYIVDPLTGKRVLALPPPAGGGNGASLVVESELAKIPLVPRGWSWWALLALLLTAGYVWVRSAASRLFLFDFHQIQLRTLNMLPPPEELDHPILVLGLPRAGKDSAVRAYIQQRAEKVDLKAAEPDAAWLNRILTELGFEAGQSPPAQLQAKAAAAGATQESSVEASQQVDGAGASPPRWIHITNLEASLNDRNRRDVALRLIDTLLRVHCAPVKPKLVVTSVVDPMFHFDSIFPDENVEVDRDHLPETEFGSWAHVLLEFERVLAIDHEPAPSWAQEDWGKGLWDECHHNRRLRQIAAIIADQVEVRIKDGKRAPRRGELIEELQENAYALYKLFWSACTRPEKLMLVQLAQTGLVNPLGKDTLQELIRKGLIVMWPYPKIMNESFERFLETAADREQIRNWEKEGGESHWPLVRNVLVILLVFALVMIGVSQDHTLQAISGIVAAVGGSIGGSFKLLDVVSRKLGKSAVGVAAG